MSWLVILGLALTVALLAWLDAGSGSDTDGDAPPWDAHRDDVHDASLKPAARDETTLSLVSEDGWAVPDAEERSLEGRRWWTGGAGMSAAMLVVAEGDLFGRSWNVYEIEDQEPRLIAAIPLATAPSVHDLLGEQVDAADGQSPASGSVWTQVPAHVERSLAATAAWVGRNSGIPHR